MIMRIFNCALLLIFLLISAFDFIEISIAVEKETVIGSSSKQNITESNVLNQSSTNKSDVVINQNETNKSNQVQDSKHDADKKHEDTVHNNGEAEHKKIDSNGHAQKQKLIPQNIPSSPLTVDSDIHMLGYSILMVVVIIFLLFLGIHYRRKIMGCLLEGRGARRSGKKVRYRRLEKDDENIEEA